jgi:mRNA-degrading endonuclease RelE of RelBE toxin-antitoxin system
MKHAVTLTDEAKNQLRHLPRPAAAEIFAVFETHLVTELRRESKSRIKFLRGRAASPQYRLRINDYRAYYDVVGSLVKVIAILQKHETYKYLEGRE